MMVPNGKLDDSKLRQALSQSKFTENVVAAKKRDDALDSVEGIPNVAAALNGQEPETLEKLHEKKLVIIGGDFPAKDKPEDVPDPEESGSGSGSGSSSSELLSHPTIKPALRFFQEHNIRTNDGRKFKVMADAVTREVVSVVAEGLAADTVVGKGPDDKEHDFPVNFNFILYVNGQRMEEDHIKQMGVGGEEYAKSLRRGTPLRVTDTDFCATLAELYDRQSIPWETKAIIDAKRQAKEMEEKRKPKGKPIVTATGADLKSIEVGQEFMDKAKGMNRKQRRRLLKDMSRDMKHPPRDSA